jgi:hypothetical protein
LTRFETSVVSASASPDGAAGIDAQIDAFGRGQRREAGDDRPRGRGEVDLPRRPVGHAGLFARQRQQLLGQAPRARGRP